MGTLAAGRLQAFFSVGSPTFKYDIRNYGAKGDGIVLYGVAISSGTPNLSCTNAKFTNADVGKLVSLQNSGLDGSLTADWSTILSVQSSTTCTLSGNVGHTYTNGVMLYGTDNAVNGNLGTSSIQAALNAAALVGQDAYAPAGIFMHAGLITVPPGIIFRGAGRPRMIYGSINGAFNLSFIGCTLLAVSYIAGRGMSYGSGSFVTVGNGAQGILPSAKLVDMAVSASNLLGYAVSHGTTAFSNEIDNVCMMLGVSAAYQANGASAYTRNILLAGANQGHSILINGGDQTIDGFYAFGAGNGKHIIHVGGASTPTTVQDVWIKNGRGVRTVGSATDSVGNHIYLNLQNNAGSIHVDDYIGDTCYGADWVELDVAAGTVSDVSLNKIRAFNNPGYTNATPFAGITLNAASGTTLRGLSIRDCNMRGNYDNSTGNPLSYFINNASTGTILGSTVAGNTVIDIATGALNALTPTAGAGTNTAVNTSGVASSF